MTLMITEVLYNGRDNSIDLLLKVDGEAYDLSDVTKAELDVEGTVINSNGSPNAFDWDTDTTGKIILTLGGEGLSEGFYTAELILYAPTFTNGVSWGFFKLRVYD